MRFFASIVTLAAAVVVSAVDIPVTVGDGGALVFNPTSVTAAVGDTISFQFRAKNHTVTQSTFASPCTLKSEGIDSGFQAVAAGATEFPSWSITIDDISTPLWFYCKQKSPANHCQAGMVFAVNPTTDQSFDAFLAAAKASSSSPSSSGGYGGYGTGTGTSTGGSSTSTAASGNGAIRMGGSAVSILAVAGLVAGLVL
jgi:hypothetical protein